MAQKPADSVRFEVQSTNSTSSADAKAKNERRLIELGAEFFGHDEFTHTGFRHQQDTQNDWELFSSAIFYDETPYA